MRQEIMLLNQERDVSLTAYIQEVEGEYFFKKRPAMLVIPGGGYTMCSDREADPVARTYARAGYQTFILRYTCTPKGKWPLPLEDYEAAMELITENADLWHLDRSKICVVGFSAGGHLAACAATIAKHKPAAAILVYPAILREVCDACQPGMPSPCEYVTPGICPCFLVAARDDRTVSVKNALMMELALAENDIPFESHIYSFGGHGFSTADCWINTNSVSSRVPHWVEDSIEWLKENIGELTSQGIGEPNPAVKLNGNHDATLSVSCTLNHIRKQAAEVQELLKPFYDSLRGVAQARNFHYDNLVAVLGANTLRELMEMLQIPAETIHQVNLTLQRFENRQEVK